jgi:hypothetical protein
MLASQEGLCSVELVCFMRVSELFSQMKCEQHSVWDIENGCWRECLGLRERERQDNGGKWVMWGVVVCVAICQSGDWCWITKARHKLTLCCNYCFSTGTIATSTHFTVTPYVHRLSWLYWSTLLSHFTWTIWVYIQLNVSNTCMKGKQISL